MILTGEAKEAFEKWLLTHGNEVIKNGTVEYDLYYMCKYMIPENMVCAKIIEWLDSVSIYVYVEPSIPIGWENPDCFIFKVGTDTNRLKFPNRQQATEKAIEKAIEIYNEKHK